MKQLPIQYLSAVDGSRVAYVVQGQGVEMVHMPFPFGNALQRTRADVFDPWYAGLAERFRLVRYEGRGHGYGERAIRSFGIDDILRDLDVVVASVVNTPSFYLLAGFWYANAALEYAVRCPERVRGLILWLPYSSKVKRSAGLNYIAENDWQVLLRNVAAMNHFAKTEEELRAEISELSEGMDQHDYMLMRSGFEAMPDVVEILARVNAPTLLVKSRDAITSYVTDIAAMASHLPCATTVTLDGSSNCPIDHQTPPTLDAIDAFVAGLGGAVARGGNTSGPEQEAGLSLREREVLERIAAGRSNADIAAEFVLSTRTVERHVRNIYNKLGVHNRVEAANWATRNGVR